MSDVYTVDEIAEKLSPVFINAPVDLFEASQIVESGRAQRETAETGVVIYERR